MPVNRTGPLLLPNNNRVIYRPFEPSTTERMTRILSRVMELSDERVDALLAGVLTEFHGRHHLLIDFFRSRFEAVRQHLLTDRPLTEARELLIGAYFTQEYALESAALFNPSIVWHPDQQGLPPGTRRFVLSLRAIGEGHISSIVFRTGTIDATGTITVAAPTGFVTPPRLTAHKRYDKPVFTKKLTELGIVDGVVELVFAALDERFAFGELEAALGRVSRHRHTPQREWQPFQDAILSLARANYEIECAADSDISERLVFPYAPQESSGIEDARFVRFVDDDGSVRYYATYTAFAGNVVLPQLLETSSFMRFRVSTLNGPAVANKGLALFPRRINGRYCMLGRQDGENIYLMDSDNCHFWHTKRLIVRPSQPWQYVQIGNCGSPLETDAGWLVLTHGVGPMRKYSIGAILLDLEDPARVIGRLREPLLAPAENERAGYVPNVVYSCGSILHDGLLVVPYSMSDYATAFATVPLDEVLAAVTATG